MQSLDELMNLPGAVASFEYTDRYARQMEEILARQEG